MLRKINRHKNLITAIAGLLIVLGLMAKPLGYPFVRDILLIVATIIAGLPIGINAFQALRLKVFSIELLVTIAVIGALIIGEYVESSAVTFLFLFGAFLEARTLEKTRSSLKALIDMAPKEAAVIRDGQIIKILIDEVVIGDKIILKSGDKVPVDGIVISGEAGINEAAITGESVPAGKEKGDKVYSGTIVDSGYLEIIAEKVGDDTTFAKIIELVEEAQETKSKAERFLDKFASVYTPAIIVLAAAVFLITRNLHLAITFLVVACPGALVIGAPVSNVAGIGNGAKNGVLIKGGEVMDRLSKVDTMVFDKTGTLTKGRPEVTDIKVFDLISVDSEADHKHKEDQFLSLVALAETVSEHHLGRTIVREAESRGLNFAGEIQESEIIKGGGIKVRIGGMEFGATKNPNAGETEVVAGNRKLMEAAGIDIPKQAEEYATQKEKAGNTAVFISINGEMAGIISIADTIRDDAHVALARLRKSGIKKMIMLTGDNRHTAEAVAKELELDEFYAELLPEEKLAKIKELKANGHVVAMAGDGINDAPAIATADIGLAMGEGGTDVSMETADMVLMADKLTQLSHAYSLAKATIRNVKQNTGFAVITVLLLLAGVLNGTVHLASGMFVHEGSILIVIFNAMRLIRFKAK